MEKKSYFQRISELTPTRFWINNVTREEAQLAIDAGAVGCTLNPSYTWKMIGNQQEKKYVLQKLDKILKMEKEDNEALIKLQRELAAEIAKIFSNIYKKSNGRQGFVSIQGDPFNENTESIIHYALYNCEVSPNIMAKIPVTKEGLEALKVLIAKKIPINATEVMAVRQALDVCKAYLEATIQINDPAPIYFSHITGIYDEYLKSIVEKEMVDISPDVLWQAGISIAKKIYWMVKEKNYPVGFIGGGARGLQHFTEMVGADCCITINWEGTADQLIDQNPPVVQRFLAPTPYSVEDELLDKLEDYRRGYMVNGITEEEYEHFGPVVLFRSMFEEAWSKALNFVRERRTELKK